MAELETIFALSSGRLPAGVAVIRLSGPRVRFVLETIFGSVPDHKEMAYGSFRDLSGHVIDRGLAVFFAGPKSFTGEDCGECHVHGGRAVVRALSAVLASLETVRHAEPGEFTRRAFLNGKLDLTQAEGVGDLIAAETEAQRKLALMQSDGVLRSLYDGWRARLVHCRSMVEAAIDFSDEDDVGERALANIQGLLGDLAGEIRLHLGGYRQSEIIRDGFNVVILGAANSGKSTLLNALAGREAAIASDEPGTTRDLIDVRLDLAGCLVIVTDTAGLRDNAGVVEAIGIDRARGRAAASDLVLWVEDAARPVPIVMPDMNVPVLRVGNKVDCLTAEVHGYDLLVSAATGQGISELLTEIAERASYSSAGTELFAVQDRQCALLGKSVDEIASALYSGLPLDLVAEHLRLASDLVGRLTGRVEVEELLGVIFSKFCIGK